MRLVLKRNALLSALLVMTLVLSACSGRKSPEENSAQAFADMREEVLLVITDPSRSQQVVELVGNLERRFEILNAAQQQLTNDLRELNRNYDATQLEFDGLITMAEATIAGHHKALIRINREFVALTTAAEWEQLNKTRSKALDAALANGSQGS